VLWVGSADGMERALVERAGIPYQGVRTGKVRGVNPLRAAASIGKMAMGVGESQLVLRRFNPDVCLVTGGYVSAPVVMAARLQRTPVMIYLPDMTPGWSIQRMSRFAARVAVSFPDAASFFGGEAPAGKAVVTGYPVRQELVDAAKDRNASRRELAQALERPLAGGGEPPLVLIWGGSQGSRSINRATWSALNELLPAAHILHVVGTRDWPLYEAFAAERPLPPELAARYHPVAYLHDEMPLALAAADLTVARAGASSLGEFPAAHLPSILVPLPMAGVNQQRNAEQLARHGAAVIIDDEKLGAELGPTLLGLVQDDERRAAMAAAAADLAQPDAALNIASALIELYHLNISGRSASH